MLMTIFMTNSNGDTFQPFFGSKVTQSLGEDASTRRLAAHTGMDLDLEYHNALFLRDEKASFVFKDKEFNGIIRGVSKKGLLQVEVMRELREFNMKEIQFIF